MAGLEEDKVGPTEERGGPAKWGWVRRREARQSRAGKREVWPGKVGPCMEKRGLAMWGWVR